MPHDILLDKVDPMAVVNAVNETLRRIDARLMDHGERVAFIACELCEAGALPLDMETLFLLSIFHDIGAYKTDEIDRMVEFETGDVWNHSAYGYLFLKHMTPLKDYAQAILHHHTPWHILKDLDTDCRDYASLIHLADRMDIAANYDAEKLLMGRLLDNSQGLLREEYLSLARAAVTERDIARRLAVGSYRKTNAARCRDFISGAAEALEYMKMLV